MTDSRVSATRAGPPSDLLVDIKVALARIEERQVALQKADEAGQKSADHRHANVMQAISAFVPRSEIEKDNRALNARIDDLEKRITSVEKRIWSAVGLILTTAVGTVASVFKLVVKVG